MGVRYLWPATLAGFLLMGCAGNNIDHGNGPLVHSGDVVMTKPCFASPNRDCLIQEALTLIEKIPEGSEREFALAEIARAQAKAGAINEALATAQKIGIAEYHANTLAVIAEAQVRFGMDRFEYLGYSGSIQQIQKHQTKQGNCQ